MYLNDISPARWCVACKGPANQINTNKKIRHFFIVINSQVVLSPETKPGNGFKLQKYKLCV